MNILIFKFLVVCTNFISFFEKITIKSKISFSFFQMKDFTTITNDGLLEDALIKPYDPSQCKSDTINS